MEVLKIHRTGSGDEFIIKLTGCESDEIFADAMLTASPENSQLAIQSFNKLSRAELEQTITHCEQFITDCPIPFARLKLLALKLLLSNKE